jgi:hypothetical protein
LIPDDIAVAVGHPAKGRDVVGQQAEGRVVDIARVRAGRAAAVVVADRQ